MDSINKPMKILHVVGAMNRAGTETMLMNIFRNINREHVQFDFISYSKDDAHYDKEIKGHGGRVIKLSKTSSVMEIYRVIKRYGPYDVVHAHTLFHAGIACVAAYLAGVKVRISHAHTTADDSKSLKRKFYMKGMRLLINVFSTNLLACSRAAGKYLFGESGLRKQAFLYYPNVIDHSRFLKCPQLAVNKFKIEAGLGNSIVIGHIGRFTEAKNHLFLLEIMKYIVEKDASVKLLLIGDGELKQWIEEKAKRMGMSGNVVFVGIRNDISTILHAMNVFVFPSLYEGLGMVLLEAQASGLPCVVSEAIQPEADIKIGLITKLSLAKGPEIWAEKIMTVTNNKERNINNITEGFEASGYALTSGISTLMKIYKSHAGGKYEQNIDRLI